MLNYAIKLMPAVFITLVFCVLIDLLWSKTALDLVDVLNSALVASQQSS